MYVIAIVALADGSPCDAAGQFVCSYDPDAHGGRGDGTLSRDISDAKRFETGGEAYEFWRTQARPPHDLRPDGLPNRPLTSYSVLIRQFG